MIRCYKLYGLYMDFRGITTAVHNTLGQIPRVFRLNIRVPPLTGVYGKSTFDIQQLRQTTKTFL